MEEDAVWVGHGSVGVLSVHSRSIEPPGTAGLQSYLDDVLTFHQDTLAHLERLWEVFEAHRQDGIRLKPAKTKLFKSKVNYLGNAPR